MKKILLIATALVTAFSVQAQKSKVTTATLNLQDNDIVAAKENIDLAATNESTINYPKMWRVRGDVYLRIAEDSTKRSMEPEAASISLKSYIKAIELEKNEKRKDETQKAYDGMLMAVIPTYYRGLYYYENKNFDQAIANWGLIIDAFEYDPENKIEKMNLSKSYLMNNCADAAINAKDNATAKKYFQLMMNDVKYKEPLLYYRMAMLYIEEGDTNTGLDFVNKGADRYPENKDLFNLQLNIYSIKGKTDILIDKLTDAINNPDISEKEKYHFNRGTLYDQASTKQSEIAKNYDDSLYSVNKSIRSEKVAAKKAKLQAKATEYEAAIAAHFSKSKELNTKAEADYKAAIELNSEYYDAYYNLGALYFNGNAENISKYNNVDTRDPKAIQITAEIKKTINAQYEKALKAFLNAYEIKTDDQYLLSSIQQTYAQLGNDAKSEEFRKLKMELIEN